MVDKITNNPCNIRGLGNIIIGKSSSDFTGFKSNLSPKTEEINGMSMTVFGCNFNPSSMGKFTINSNGHLIYTEESDGNVNFSINSNGHLIVEGDNESSYSIIDGHCIYGG